MMLQYVIGDATASQGAGPRVIVPVCNDVGGWGCGFVLALSRRWPEPEQRYRAWYRGEETTPSLFVAVRKTLEPEMKPDP